MKLDTIKQAKEETISENGRQNGTLTLKDVGNTPDISRRTKKINYGTISYYITQLLGGYDCFQAYLFRFKRATSSARVYL